MYPKEDTLKELRNKNHLKELFLFKDMLYQKVIKPVLFKTDPEKIHNLMVHLGKGLGRSKLIKKIIASYFKYCHFSLAQTVDGIKYQNPIGLAAGFDKNVNLIKILPALGFGFQEVGSITALPCLGNPKPRIWRLPKHKSLVVYSGLNNIGCQAVAKKLRYQKFSFPVGISIAKTNCQATVDPEAAVLDYYQSFILLEPYASYITINISCPNAFGGQPFTSPGLLDKLLIKLDSVKTNKPIYLKLSPDLSFKQVDEILSVSKNHNLQGFITGNLTKNREGSGIPQKEFSKVGEGGLSGKPVAELSNSLISYIYQKTKGKYTIIGCGGVFTAQDAYTKIKAGASLVQLVTGLIFEGPGIIKKINQRLVYLLKNDGFNNVSEAIGVDCKK
jgi:dihydroorotate dehydrogenase